MAINPQKLLPPASIKGSTKIVKVSKFLPATQKGGALVKPDSAEKEAEEIRVRVVDITNLVSNNNLLRRRQIEQQRIQEEDAKIGRAHV